MSTSRSIYVIYFSFSSSSHEYRPTGSFANFLEYILLILDDYVDEEYK